MYTHNITAELENRSWCIFMKSFFCRSSTPAWLMSRHDVADCLSHVVVKLLVVNYICNTQTNVPTIFSALVSHELNLKSQGCQSTGKLLENVPILSNFVKIGKNYKE